MAPVTSELWNLRCQQLGPFFLSVSVVVVVVVRVCDVLANCKQSERLNWTEEWTAPRIHPQHCSEVMKVSVAGLIEDQSIINTRERNTSSRSSVLWTHTLEQICKQKCCESSINQPARCLMCDGNCSSDTHTLSSEQFPVCVFVYLHTILRKFVKLCVAKVNRPSWHLNEASLYEVVERFCDVSRDITTGCIPSLFAGFRHFVGQKHRYHYIHSSPGQICLYTHSSCSWNLKWCRSIFASISIVRWHHCFRWRLM